MPSDFTGKGWKLPLELDRDGEIVTTQPEDCIVQSVWMILGTARGERVMRPRFGCGIHDLVFAVSSAGTAGRAV